MAPKKSKIKLSDLAKDFGLKNAELINILKPYSEKAPTAQKSLETRDLDIIFDTLTLSHSAKDTTAYAALVKPGADAAPAAAEPQPEQPKPAAKPEPEKKPDEPAAKKPEARPAAPAAEQPKKKKKSDGPIQARTKGEVRKVDTRQTEVDLDKYNERYTDMAGQNERRTDRESFGRQKINQRSKQYRKGAVSRKRETERDRVKRLEAERSKRHISVEIGETIVVSDLAEKLHVKPVEVVKKLMNYGVMASQTESIDFDTAEIVATELGAKVTKETVVTIEDRIIDTTEDTEENLQPRSPVVVVMGHVDHGKTSLLDAIRHTSVTATESGGITQHIGAYKVTLNDNDITFLDTPGHAAFTSMRARGAMATDIAVLVVAADDGIMPQTIEAIHHAKAANVSIIVAINKMDKPDANPQRVMQQLTEHELVPEEWGGDVICVPVSAKTGMGLDKLLEAILLVAEMRELRANPDRAANGVVIEARLDKGKGPVATLLVQKGTLHTGDTVVAGLAVGKVRVMSDYRGRRVKAAGPSTPVEITGLADTPEAGDTFDAVSDEKLARELVEQRKEAKKQEEFKKYHKVTLENLFSTIAEGEVKELNLIVRADVQGSVEAVIQSLEKLSTDEVKVRVISSGVGAINESDIMLAHVSNAIVIGFRVRPDSVAEQRAERDNVEMHMYMVIYDCIEDIENAIKGLSAPKVRDVDIGKAEVRDTFRITGVGMIAGCYITSGKVIRNAKIRVVRDGIVVAEDEMSSLKRFKEDAKEVAQGYECGIGLAKFNDIKVGDIFEAYLTEEYRD